MDRNRLYKFNSRGVGLDVVDCFCCGTSLRAPGTNHYMNNIAAFVANRDSGEAIAALFGGYGTFLDYRGRYPDRVQLKIGACDKHVSNLQALHDLTQAQERQISLQIIIDARNYEAKEEGDGDQVAA
jgi:hypothetical protein